MRAVGKRWEDMTWQDITWHEDRRDEKRCHWIRWDELRWEYISWCVAKFNVLPLSISDLAWPARSNGNLNSTTSHVPSSPSLPPPFLFITEDCPVLSFVIPAASHFTPRSPSRLHVLLFISLILSSLPLFSSPFLSLYCLPESVCHTESLSVCLMILLSSIHLFQPLSLNFTHSSSPGIWPSQFFFALSASLLHTLNPLCLSYSLLLSSSLYILLSLRTSIYFSLTLSLSLSVFILVSLWLFPYLSLILVSLWLFPCLSLSLKVSEDMLRLVVEEAQRSVTGIDTGEGRMIKAVLDMQDTEVCLVIFSMACLRLCDEIVLW